MMSTDIQFNVDQALAKLGDLLQQHGPQTIELASRVVQVNAIGQAVSGGIFLAVAAGFGLAASRLLPKAMMRARDKRYIQSEIYEDRFGWWAAFCASTAVSLVCAIAALVNLADPWLWVAFTNPKLALARQVLARVAGI